MVVSLAITTIILGAFGSIMLLAARALTVGATGVTVSTTADAAAAEQVAADLRVATRIIEKTATSVTFTVPDRNADGMPETLCYAWAGAGSPLTRQCNGLPVPAASIADNVQDFRLTYLDRTATPPPALPPVELPEQVLVSHDDAPGGTFLDSGIADTSWASAYFSPTLPANALSWKITRVKFMAKCAPVATDSGTTTSSKGGTSMKSASRMMESATLATESFIAAEVRSANTALEPGSTILESASFDAATLPSGASAWAEVSYSALGNLSPGVGLCLTITSAYSVANAFVQYESGGSPMTARTHWMTSVNKGGSWTAPDDLKDMRFYVYGKITIQP
jgi:hypothetical protein